MHLERDKNRGEKNPTIILQGSCVLHDMCYLKKGRSKSGCDSDFLYNMQKQCGTDVACRATLAPSVYAAVKHDGGAQSGYERAQRIARTCRLY